jgi:hypothetical protein
MMDMFFVLHKNPEKRSSSHNIFLCSTMKLLLLPALLTATASSFVPLPRPQKVKLELPMATKGESFLRKMFQPIVKDTWIERAFNDFEPIHGHGTGEKKLDEIYEAEQDLLKERKKHFGVNNKKLKDKYRDFKTDHHGEIQTIAQNPADLNQEEDDAMHF